MISKLVLRNFKSYQNEAIEQLSPGVNLFVGNNGNGKSNIFIGKEVAFNSVSAAFSLLRPYQEGRPQAD